MRLLKILKFNSVSIRVEAFNRKEAFIRKNMVLVEIGYKGK